jgi:hypothetical protein
MGVGNLIEEVEVWKERTQGRGQQERKGQRAPVCAYQVPGVSTSNLFTIYLFIFAVLGIEPWAWYLLDKCSISQAMLPVL